MNAVVDQINHLVTVLNTVSPEWYIVAVGPLLNVAQHFIKLERLKTKKLTRTQNELLAIFFAALAGAFYGVIHTPEGASLAAAADLWLKDTALVGSPIWVVAFLLFKKVSSKLEERHELLRNADGTLLINPDDVQPPAIESAVAADGTLAV